MAGRITRMAFQQRTADRVNVYLDGQFAFALPALEAAGLRIGQYLDDSQIVQLSAAGELQKTYDRAVRYLSFRPRSREEVRRHLAQAGLDAEVIEAALDRLVEQHYLDDAEFARYWVENRQQFRPKGPQALRQELRQRGIEDEAIEDILADADPPAEAYRAAGPIAARLAGLAQSDPLSFRRKVSSFLLRRGFGYSVAQEVVNRLVQESGSDAETMESDD